jgi:hypothetical protein
MLKAVRSRKMVIKTEKEIRMRIERYKGKIKDMELKDTAWALIVSIHELEWVLGERER